MPEKKNILLTFDYELFLGSKSGTVDNCLIYPTRKIINTLNVYNAKGIFFVDTTYLIRLQQESTSATRNDFYQISEQIKILVQEGHYVFPHLHPHWTDAQYDPQMNEWILQDVSKYRFHNVLLSEREKIFEQSIKILQEIITPVYPGYQLDGFRAGGWSIQPYLDFKPFFEKYRIKYDFSVLPKAKFISDAQYYDFSTIPLKPVYRFSDDITKEDENGNMTEFVISKIRIGSIRKIFNRFFLKLYKFQNEKLGDGLSVNFFSTTEKYIDNFEMISLDLLTAVKRKPYLDFISNNSYMQFISHPKMMSWHSFTEFNKFLEITYRSFEVETDFKKMV